MKIRLSFNINYISLLHYDCRVHDFKRAITRQFIERKKSLRKLEKLTRHTKNKYSDCRLVTISQSEKI